MVNVVVSVREALEWAIAEIEGRTRYDSARQFENAISVAKHALEGASASSMLGCLKIDRANISDEELQEWASMRADDAGRLARELVGFRRAIESLPPHTVRPSSTTLSRDAFVNALRILHSMEPNWLPAVFARDPVEYLLRADDPTVDRIWAAIQERQPARYRA